MPRKVCCNPLGLDLRQVTKNIRKVTAAAVSTGLVKEGDLICCTCRKKVMEKLKPKDPREAKETVENSPDTSPAIDTHNQPPNVEALLSESEVESMAGESVAEESAAESVDESFVAEDANNVLIAVGESPVKRKGLNDQKKASKIRRKLKTVKENLEVAYGTNIPDDQDKPTANRYSVKLQRMEINTLTIVWF